MDVVNISPDKSQAVVRYGLMELGDGRAYCVARAGFGPRGVAMLEVVDRFRAETAFARSAAFAVELFRLALAPFYSDAIVDALIESEAFGVEHMPRLLDVVLGNDIDMSQSAGVATGSSTGTSTGQSTCACGKKNSSIVS